MLPIIRKATVIQKYTFDSAIKTNYKIPFPDNEDLRNVKLWGVQSYYGRVKEELFSFGILESEPDYQLPLINKDTFQKTFLTLYDKNNVEFLKQCPIIVFQTIQNNIELGSNRIEGDICERDNKVFTGQFLDLQNSYYELINIDLKGEYSFVTEFYYSRIDLDAQTKIN
jgi:hypothetical protein